MFHKLNYLVTLLF